MIKEIFPAFAPSAEFKRTPIVKDICNALDSIYIPRGGSKETKDKALECIKKRQETIE